MATTAINTPERPAGLVALPIAAATTLYQGTFNCIDGNGRLVTGSDTAGLRIAGISTDTFDNSAGAAGAIKGTSKHGCFLLANSATNAITAAMVGKTAFIEDNATVANTSANKIAAGRIIEVSSEGVWVDTRFARTYAAVAQTSTDGVAAAASASLANLAAEAEKIGDDVRAVIAALNL